MKNAGNLLNDAKAQWNRVKTEIEKLNVQLSLGSSEAKETFEREWKKFSGFLDEQSQHLRRHSHWVSKLLEELKQRTVELKTLLKQATPENEHEFTNRREDLLRTMYELEFIIDQLYPALGDEEKHTISTFRIKMEVYRTRFIITSLSELASLDAQVSQLTYKADEVLDWLEHDSEFVKEKIQRFSKGIGTSFDHMKQAFGELFK